MLSKLTFVLATVLLADTCNRQGIEKEVLEVKETRADCTGTDPMQCLQVKHAHDTAWTLLYSKIEGFDYEEGYRYKISVKVSPVKDPPADGSSLRYELDRVLEKNKVEATSGNDTGNTLQQKRWVLKEMSGVAQEQSPIWLEFDTAKHRFHGNGGCNNLSGGYETEGDNISFLQVISTRMACVDQAANERESALLRMLTEHTYQVKVSGETLSLSDSGKVVLQFGAQEKPAKEAPAI